MANGVVTGLVLLRHRSSNCFRVLSLTRVSRNRDISETNAFRPILRALRGSRCSIFSNATGLRRLVICLRVVRKLAVLRPGVKVLRTANSGVLLGVRKTLLRTIRFIVGLIVSLCRRSARSVLDKNGWH